jgi:hypothetical protein
LGILLRLDANVSYGPKDILEISYGNETYKSWSSEKVDTQVNSLIKARTRLSLLLTTYYSNDGKNDNTIIELHAFKVVIKRRLHDEFVAFFGDGALDRRGVVILQSSPIEDLLESPNAEPVIGEESGRILMTPSSRLYKARTWINKWDTESAQAIRDEVEKYNPKGPAFVFSDRHHSDPNPTQSPPFQISMGLGFTEQTDTLLAEVCNPWMRISRKLDSGDTVCFHDSLRPTNGLEPARLRIAEGEETEFFRILPRDWKSPAQKGERPAYMNRWLSLRKYPNQHVWDYAIILRHTELTLTGERRIFFVVAGFTERSTAAAGHHLATRWPDLYDTYVKPQELDRESRGDFLIVITGLSNPVNFGDWAEDRLFPAITPARLEGIRCDWTERLVRPLSISCH